MKSTNNFNDFTVGSIHHIRRIWTQNFAKLLLATS